MEEKRQEELVKSHPPTKVQPEGLTGGCGYAGRSNAHNTLLEMINRHERAARRLRCLLDALPAKLPAEADEALWDLLMLVR